MARQRSSRRFSRGKKHYMWTSVLIGANAAAAIGVQDLSPIVANTDWASGSGLDNATLIRIRGWFSVAQDAATDGAVMAYIGLFDNDETPPSPETGSTYTDEVILWTDGFQYEASTTSQQTFHVDVKAKRKFTSGQSVILNVLAKTTAMRISGVCRALIQLA